MKKNSILETSKFEHEFSETGITRIFNFLQLEDIEKLKLTVERQVDFGNAFYVDGKNHQVSDIDIQKLPKDTKQKLFNDIHLLASQGSGFLYGRHKIESSSTKELNDVLNFMNQKDTLDLIKKITNMNSLDKADAQATKYRRGDFLTRHIDNIPGETRRVAYVLGITEGWHPDWGGLLQFFSKDGTPNKSWAPTFNSLTLFDVNKIHSVTSIAQFAAKSRYSITGWFRD